MDPLRYVAVGVATGTAGWLLFAFGGRVESVAGIVAQILALLLAIVATALVVIGVIGAGVRAGRRD